jgi:hypothetical protein
MKKVFFIMSMVICTGLYGQKDKSYHSHRHEPGIDDFKSTSSEFQYSEKSKLAYCISNDDENIYVDLLITAADVQRQVFSSGITLWISNDGKKSKKLGIKYPVRIQNQVPPSRQGGGQIPNQTGNMNQQRPGQDRNMPGGFGGSQSGDAGAIELIGFSGSDTLILTSSEEDNFRGSIRIERDKHMYYEVILPLSMLPELNDQPSEGKDNKGSFLIGIAYNTIVAGPMGGYPGGGMPGGGRPSGGGGRPSGGGGRPGGASAGPQAPPASQTIFWIEDIRLAAKN